MDTTIFLAQFWGWLLVIVGIIFLVRKDLLQGLYSLVEEKTFNVLAGYLALILGLVTVLLHNEWVSDWPVIITVVGWLSLLKGIGYLAFPKCMQSLVPMFRNNAILTGILLVIVIILGGWLVVASM